MPEMDEWMAAAAGGCGSERGARGERPGFADSSEQAEQAGSKNDGHNGIDLTRRPYTYCWLSALEHCSPVQL